jgi:hypothetical protein
MIGHYFHPPSGYSATALFFRAPAWRHAKPTVGALAPAIMVTASKPLAANLANMLNARGEDMTDAAARHALDLIAPTESGSCAMLADAPPQGEAQVLPMIDLWSPPGEDAGLLLDALYGEALEELLPRHLGDLLTQLRPV